MHEHERGEIEQGKYLPSRPLRRRYHDISDMTLWRWLNDDELGFPRPVIINGRRYWLISELEAWESALRDGKATAA